MDSTVGMTHRQIDRLTMETWYVAIVDNAEYNILVSV
jgi:hypothetical protein